MTRNDATAPTAVAVTVTDKVEALRKLADTDPQAAQDAVWAWFERLRDGHLDAAAELELGQLFTAGTPADVDGSTKGLLIGFVTPSSELDRAGTHVYNFAKFVTTRIGLMPWLGKKFDKAAQRGTNSLTGYAVVLCGAVAPTYRLRRAGRTWEGFDMLNRVEESVLFPGTDVLVLDYETIGTNPWPINQIRDEAVQIVPGTYLGLKIWHQADGYHQFAFWAAKKEV